MRIVYGISEADLFNQPALAPSRAARMLVGAHYVHLHFARRITAQTGTILNQHDTRTLPGGRNRRAYTCQTASGNQYIGFQVDRVHVFLDSADNGCRRRDSIEIGMGRGGCSRSGCLVCEGIVRENSQRIGAEASG